MATLKNSRRIFASLLCVAGLAACDKPGPAETAGKKMDQAADAASRDLGRALDNAATTLDEKGAKTGIAMGDTEITAKVKAAIFAEPGLKSLQISVDTEDGVVTLSGSVDSLPNSDRAQSLAGAVAGVRKVENRLVPKPSL